MPQASVFAENYTATILFENILLRKTLLSNWIIDP